MPVIGTADAAVIRSNSQAVRDFYLNIPPLTVYAVGTINASPVSYPASEVYLTGSPSNWTAIRPQQFFRITDSSGTVLKLEGAMRKIPGSGTIFYIPAIREGDTGIAVTQVPTAIGSGDLVTVYNPIVPYAYFSRVSGGTFYKRWDETWEGGSLVGSLTQYPQAVINMGDHLHFRVNPGGTATWQMSGSLAYSWIGGSLDYLWFPPTGISLVSPSVDTDQTVNFEGTVGAYRMRLRMRDNGINPDNSYRYVFITDGVNVKAFNELFDITAVDWEPTTRVGGAFTMTVKAARGTDVLSYLYKGAPVLLTWTPQYSSTGWQTVTAAPDAIIDNFYGYVRAYELISTSPFGEDTYRVRVESPLVFFGDLPVASQTLLAAGTANGGSANSWATVRNSLAHVGYFTYYLLNFHGGALLSLSDYFPTDLGSFYRPALSSPAGDMLNAAIKATALVTGANVGCTSNGAVWLKRHASYESDAWRNANGTAWTLNADDIVGDLEYTRDPIMKASETEGAASISGTLTPITVYEARAALFAGMQAVSKDTMDAFIALSTTDAGQRVGHQHQRTNSPTPEVSVTLRSGHDFIEPPLMEWYVFDLADYDPGATINQGLMSDRALPLATQRTWEFTELGIIQRLSATFEPETKGSEAPEKPAIVIGAQFTTGGAWCHAWDFVTDGSVGVWTIVQGTYPGSETGGIDGTDVEISTTFSTTTLTSVSLTVAGVGAPGGNLDIYITNGGIEASVYNSTVSNGVHTWTGTLFLATQIRIAGDRPFNWGITDVEVNGAGMAVFGANNCS